MKCFYQFPYNALLLIDFLLLPNLLLILLMILFQLTALIPLLLLNGGTRCLNQIIFIGS